MKLSFLICILFQASLVLGIGEHETFMQFEEKYLDPYKIESTVESLLPPEILEYPSELISIFKFPHHTMTSNPERFIYGLSETLFKFQPRAHSTCFNSGKKYLFDSILLFQKFIDNPYNKDLGFNFNDAFIKLLQLCNFSDTLQGIWLFMALIWVVDWLDGPDVT